MTETYRKPSSQPRRAGAGSSTEPYLVVEDLTVRFPTADGMVQAVTDLNYTLEQGKTLGIVGESGSGKSVSSMAIMGLQAHADVWLDPGRRTRDRRAVQRQDAGHPWR